MMGITRMPGRGHAGASVPGHGHAGARMPGRGHAGDGHRADAGSRSRRRWSCRRSRSEWPGGLIGELEGAQAGNENGAMVVEGEEELVAEVDEQVRGGEREDLVVFVALGKRRV